MQKKKKKSRFTLSVRYVISTVRVTCHSSFLVLLNDSLLCSIYIALSLFVNSTLNLTQYDWVIVRVKSPKISKFGKCENFINSEKMHLFLESIA